MKTKTRRKLFKSFTLFAGIVLILNMSMAGVFFVAPEASASECATSDLTVIQVGDTWKYFKGTENPAGGWDNTGFNDSSWLSGPTGIGYGDGDDATELSDMRYNYWSVYLRKEFSVTDASAVADMDLHIDYDDGFVAYINGVEVARSEMPAGTPSFNTPADTSPNPDHEAGTVENFDLSSYISGLSDGANILAIEVHNVNLDSSDLSALPELVITEEECAEPSVAELVETPVTTCQGSGELFLYQNDPFQPIKTSFTTTRNELLIFSGNPHVDSLDVRVNGSAAVKTLVFTDQWVEIFSIDTESGDLIEVDGVSENGARNVQGYLTQDSASPVYNINSTEVIWDDAKDNYVYLNPGTYSYIFFDKYSINKPADAGPDLRELNVNIDGPSGNIINQTYNQPFPSPTEGAVVNTFTAGESGMYKLSIDTEDSVYWPLLPSCEITCEEGDLSYDVDMEVVGEDCLQGYPTADSENVDVLAGGSYSVKGVVSRGNPGQSQTAEIFHLNINGDDGPTSPDDADPDAISLRLDYLGDFNFISGLNEVNMVTNAHCSPSGSDISPNSVRVEKLCLAPLEECGNGIKEGGEECDGQDGVGEHQTCSEECTLEDLTYCGDGIKQEPNDAGTGGPADDGYEECDGDDGVGLNQKCTDQCILEDVLCEAELDVVFIMDRSGSMGYEVPTRLSYAKSAANSFADKLRSGDQSALVSYANTASLDKTLNNNHTTTKAAINSLSASGATNIGDAINLATQESTSVRANPQAVKVQILLTDGKANQPNGSGYSLDPNGLEYLDVAYAINESTEAAAQGIIIFTIGLGNPADIDEGMLQTIADNTGGKYYHAPSASNLDEIFNDIAFQACEYGSISGCKYLDSNNDGDISGETTIPGWEITLQGSNGPISQFTDGQGCYAFSGLLPGTYTVSEVLQGDYIQTYPLDPNNYSIILSDSESVGNIDFGNYLPVCGNNIIDEGEQCDDGNIDNGDGCSSTCQEEICAHNVGVRYNYTNSFSTGIAVRPDGGDWMDDPVQLLRNGLYDIKYYIDNLIKNTTNNINVIVKVGSEILADYDSEINSYHYNTVSLDTTGMGVGTTTISVSVDKINETDCDYSDNYAEREIEIIAVCGDGITDENLDEQCDDGNDINDDGCTNQCTLPSGGPEYGSIKACKLVDADGILESTGDRTPVYGWEFILDDGLATTSQITDGEIGCTVFSNLLAGDYEISETLGAGWVALWPETGTSTVAVAANQETQIDFINTKAGLISGYKFEDNDLASSTNLLIPKAGWVINLAYTSASTTPIASTTTDVNGYYEFSVMPGEYTVFEEMQDNWEAVSVASLDVVISGGDVSENNNFVNHQNPFCGDGAVNQEIEQCDGSAGVGANQSCSQECTIDNLPYCGDGKVDGGEQCDDGNTAGGDGCSASCTTEGGGGGTFIITGGGGPIVLGEEGEPILGIDKIVDPGLVNPGDEVEYTVTVVNSGNLTAFDVVINDTLPDGFVFSADGASTRAISVGDLGAGESKTYKYKVTVTDGVSSGIYANIAQAVASNHDPVNDYADVEVKEIEVLGVELAPTGFKPAELVILLLGLVSLTGASLFLRNKYRQSL